MDDLPDIAPFLERHEALTRQMAQPDFYNQPQRAAEVSREHQQLDELIGLCRRHERVRGEIGEAEALSRDPKADADLRALAAEELPQLQERQAGLHREILTRMAPPDPNDSRNTVMEVRAGTGGEEAALFAAALQRAYLRHAEARGWKIQPMSSSPSERGGFKEVIFLITGADVYKQLKYESGVHRVQRVPATEANGRIHTSTVTVAVLPEAEEVEVRIEPQDLEITVSRASGPGGQGVNTTDSAVQILHKPTGLIVQCADERSQLKNKARAMTVLRSRLLQRQREAEQEKYASERRGQIGSGDRSERIRTYNFPQSRVTDHRIGFTTHNLAGVMEGGFDELIAALQRADTEERLSRLAASTGSGTPPAGGRG